MRDSPIVQLLPDGRRLHLHDGPIDLIVEAYGRPEQIHAAYDTAGRRFVTILDELCAELPLLRQAVGRNMPRPQGVIARRMAAAVEPYAERCFITPMAAVAGAVAEEILENMTKDTKLTRCFVNNGGDIALYLTPGESFSVGMVDRPDRPSLFGTLRIRSDDPIRGLATSGWRGRSFSLGIADAVTVLAADAAAADAAATIIANAIDLPGHPEIVRVPAREIAPDNDLGELCVTRAVPKLCSDEVQEALVSGVSVAEELISEGLAVAAALHLQGQTRVVPLTFQTLNLTAERSSDPTEWRVPHG
jgi:ApbE superfamily uncharacterized protein (UPF0280 family)